MRLLGHTQQPRHLLRALRTKSDQSLHDFLEHGGLLGSRDVTYQGTTLPVDCLGPGFWVLDHLRDFLDAGGTIADHNEGYLLTAPGGLAFVTRSDELGTAISVLAEVFVRGEYDWLDVKNRVVIDIGANIGDTALYFASRGAAHVYAYEPFQKIYRAAERNLNLAGLDNITLEHAGVGAEREQIRVKDDGWVVTRTSDDKGEAITILDLAGVVNHAINAHPGKPLACKVDCEGYEHELFKNGVADFSSVEQWMVEVHGRLGQIPDVLAAAGFDVAVQTKGNVWMVCARLVGADS